MKESVGDGGRYSRSLRLEMMSQTATREKLAGRLGCERGCARGSLARGIQEAS